MTRLPLIHIACSISTLLLCAGSPAQAGISLSPVSTGDYEARLDLGSLETNRPFSPFSVGEGVGRVIPHYFNAYAVFNLSTIPDAITGLSLSGSITNIRRNEGGTPYSSYTSMTLAVTQVQTSYTDITKPYDSGSSKGFAIWQDLNDGGYVGFTVDNGKPPYPPDPNRIILGPKFQVDLGSTAVSDANADRLGSGYFIVGFSGSAKSNYERLGDISNLSLSVQTLHPVPEPASLLSLLLGGGTLLLLNRARLRRPG